jgi:hypothetical protein
VSWCHKRVHHWWMSWCPLGRTFGFCCLASFANSGHSAARKQLLSCLGSAHLIRQWESSGSADWVSPSDSGLGTNCSPNCWSGQPTWLRIGKPIDQQFLLYRVAIQISQSENFIGKKALGKLLGDDLFMTHSQIGCGCSFNHTSLCPSDPPILNGGKKHRCGQLCSTIIHIMPSPCLPCHYHTNHAIYMPTVQHGTVGMVMPWPFICAQFRDDSGHKIRPESPW